MVCGAVAAERLLTTGASGFAVALAGLGLFLFALVAALGRLVVTVEGDRLTISHGWLGLLKKTFDLAKIDEVRVRILGPDTTCYTAWVRRGAELGIGRRR